MKSFGAFEKSLTVLIALVGFWSLLFFLYPLTLIELRNRSDLRLSGFEFSRYAGFPSQVRSSCKVGEPCQCWLFLHGLGDNSLTWTPLIKTALKNKWFPEKSKLVLVDLPGSSSAFIRFDEEPPLSLNEMARILAVNLDPSCRWTVVGNSLGGWISAGMALYKPPGMEHLVLVNPAGKGFSQEEIEKIGMFFSSPTVDGFKEFQKLAFYKPRHFPDFIYSRLVARTKSNKWLKALIQTNLSHHPITHFQVPPQIHVTILWGEGDSFIPAQAPQDWLREVPQARLTLLSECGHLPQKECPLKVLQALSN